MQRLTRPFGLYIHWPFCRSKCPYCDFNSHVRASTDTAAWQAALLTEMRSWREQTPDHQLQSIFFGGGTPSLMPPALVESLIQEATRLWPSVNDLEVTLEANPTSVEAENFAGYAAAGVNRVSLGVQSLRDTDLKFLGRQHSAAEAIEAIKLAARYFPRTSFDLIYARPQQTLADWQAELNEALALNPGHISLYQLTIEANTGFAEQYKRGHFTLPEEGLAGEMYEATGSVLGQAGLYNYEISNYARPGNECRHNLIYWNYEDYIGIGAGAHGRVHAGDQHLATANIRMPEKYLQAITATGTAHEHKDLLTREEAQHEALLMGLRLHTGIDRARWLEKFGDDMTSSLNASALETLISNGDLALTPTHLRATDQGRLRLNAVLNFLCR